MRQLWTALLVCMSLLLLVHPHVAAARDAADADYYVAVDGSDDGPGTKERPLRRSLVRAMPCVN